MKLSTALWALVGISALALANRHDRKSSASRQGSTRKGVSKMASNALVPYTAPVVPFDFAASRKRARRGIVAGGAELISLRSARATRGLPAAPVDVDEDSGNAGYAGA